MAVPHRQRQMRMFIRMVSRAALRLYSRRVSFPHQMNQRAYPYLFLWGAVVDVMQSAHALDHGMKLLHRGLLPCEILGAKVVFSGFQTRRSVWESGTANRVPGPA